MLLLQRGILIGFTWLIYGFAFSTNAAIDEIINEHEGKSVVLPCPVSIDKCGELHSINWFKGDDRIAALLLDDSNVTSVAPEFEDRVTVEQNPYRVVIKDLQISDEDIYLCDTTFFIPVETCDNYNGYRIELNVLVPPAEVVILDEKGDRIRNGSVVGPMEERQTLKTSCVVRNTRPQPSVGWWRGNKRLTTHSPSYDEKDGLYTATLELELQLSRDDLAQDIECRVESAAIEGSLENSFGIDLQVRPTSITINGVEHHTVQGSKVILTCDVHGARPAVNLTWYNTTETIGVEENDLTEVRTKAFEKEDGTYHTQSELIFNATRFENDMVFRCDAENAVLQANREKPFTSSLTLEVLYPPVVKVSPPEITVNTSDTVLLNCEYEANPASLSKVVWYRNGDVVNINDTERYEGGNSENVALVIRSTDKDDIGNYTCQLSNAIGKGVSAQQIDLDVQYVPTVEVLMIPEGPVKESDESNVTLYCSILDANPAVLTKVRWYANSTLLKELPDCEETKEDLCHIDPSKLLLESIGRGFFYNYSCEGYNAAGWGPRSDDKELVVYYEPGPATLTHFPLIAVKKKSVTFSCSVEDPGYPESNRFRWMRGGRGPLQDIVTKDWTVEPVVVDSRTNYSCYAYNEGGRGVSATVNLEVHAPPFFIKNLSPYTGRLHSSNSANLTCRIECVPRCEISWLKDGVPIEPADTRYFVKEKYMDASPATGDFESMLSVLHFNISNWPNKKFDIEADNANYTCLSSGNTVGPGIKSATYFSIEYAPDNTTVSEEVVYVHEDTIPGRVICKSRANPEPTYEWRFNNKTVTRGNALIINSPMARNDSGHYVCVAFNKHGRSTAQTYIDVQFKPRCEIERREIDGQDALICTAFGNPEEADFSWSIKAENESVEWLGSKAYTDKSWIVLLDEDNAIARTYRCVANNTVGAGTFCEIEVAEQLAWWQRWDKTTLIILVASILALLLAVIIICCIIICVCRRRRRQDKYHTDVSISATHSVLSYQPTTPLPTTAASATDMACAAVPSGPTPTATPTATPTPTTTTTTTTATATATSTTTANTNTATSLATNSANLRVPEVPRSPPRWPLRPGVMVHVRSDTKKNLAANRMTLAAAVSPIAALNLSQSPAESANNTLTSQASSAVSATPSRAQMSALLHAHSPTQSPASTATAMNVCTPPQQTATLGRIPRSSKSMHRSCASGMAAESGSRLQGAPGSDGTLRLEMISGFQSLPRHAGRSFDFVVPVTACARVSPNNTSLTDLEVGIPLLEAPVMPAPQQQQQRITAPLAASPPPALPKRSQPRQAVTAIGIPAGITLPATTPATSTPNTTAHSITDMSMHHSNCELLPCSLLPKAASSERIQILAISPTPADDNEVDARLQETAESKLRSGGSKRRLKERLERCLAQFFTRTKSGSDGTRDSQRSHVGLLGVFNSARGFWQHTAPNEFAAEHRLKGIRCSGSVSYKKTPLMQQRAACAAATTTAAATASIISTTLNNNENNNNNNNHSVITTLAQNSAAAASPPPISPKSRPSVTFQISSAPQPQPQPQLQPPPPPPPPPRPPKQLVKKTVVILPTSKVEHTQIHDKSSSLADPLTEPGEYENLPFHGLQTAPNKFCAMPTNFNNSTNVVRVAPRPKRLNGNISQTYVQPPQQHEQPHRQQQQYQRQQHPQYPQHQQHQLQQFNTMQYGRSPSHPTPTQTQTVPLNRSAPDAAAGTLLPNPHQITYNLSNCFPKSYTEYYHHQQQQQQHDCPPSLASSTLEHNNTNTSNIAINSNPFLVATNFKKFDTGSGAYPASSMQSATGSMHRTKRKQLLDRAEEKKFYSLKFSNKHYKQESNVQQPPPPSVCIQNVPAMAGGHKCKRHHSFAGGSIGDVLSNGPAYPTAGCPLVYAAPDPSGKASLRFYDPPAYENLNDSVQIHEYQVESHPRSPPSAASTGYHATAVLLHAQPHAQVPHSELRTASASAGQKRKHHQRQHQQRDDFNLIEPERLSIHRSDSGISNSSYECVTPVATPRGGTAAGSTPPPSKIPKTSKHAHKSSLVNSTMTNNFHSKKSPRIIAATPLYVNVDGQPVYGPAYTEHCSSPTSTLVNSSYESASSSTTTTNGVGSADPTSLSSSNSLYSSGTGTGTGNGHKSGRCTRHQEAADLTTPEEFEQYQLGHRMHSTSSVSLASSVSVGGKKCKRRQTSAAPTLSGCVSGCEQANPTNPFLAATATAAFRRQIDAHPETHKNKVNSSNNEANNNNAKHTTCAEKSRKQQQPLQQDYRLEKRCDRSTNNSSNNNSNSTTSSRCSYQQQVLMPRQLLMQQHGLVQAASPSLPTATATAATTPKSCSSYQSQSNSNSNMQRIHKSHSAQNINDPVAPPQPIEGQEQRRQCTWHQLATRPVRPIRLPLRKHHSFNFQPSQTVAGMKTCQLKRLRLQQQQLQPFTMPLQERGPLLFHPYTLDEKHGFKPIETPPKMLDEVAAVDDENNDDSEGVDDDDATPTPERMGTLGHYFQSEASTGAAPNNGNWRPEEVTGRDFCSDGNGNENDGAPATIPPATIMPGPVPSNLMTLHPAAASLEALEALSKANPQLIYAAGAARRKNLHTQLTALEALENSRNARDRQMVLQLRAKLRGDEPEEGMEDAEPDDDDEEDEDLGYSYCEDELDDVVHGSVLYMSDNSSPNATVVLTADGGQVQYVSAVAHSCQEVHI